MSEQKTAVGYTRLSQDSDTSIDHQKDSIREFCADHGYELLDIYNDGERSSGFDDSRPEYQKMLVRVEDDDIDAIVVDSRSRLSRDRRERSMLLHDMEDLGVTVIASEQGDEIDMDDEEAWLIEMIKAYVDDAEKRREIARARRAIQARLDAGYYQGAAPPGMEFGDAGQYVVPADGFEDALEVYELRDDGLSIRDIASETQWSVANVRTILNRRDDYEKLAEEPNGRLGHNGVVTPETAD